MGVIDLLSTNPDLANVRHSSRRRAISRPKQALSVAPKGSLSVWLTQADARSKLALASWCWIGAPRGRGPMAGDFSRRSEPSIGLIATSCCCRCPEVAAGWCTNFLDRAHLLSLSCFSKILCFCDVHCWGWSGLTELQRGI